MIQKNKRLIVMLLTTAVLLLVPLIAMQITKEVNWTTFDFVAAGVLLFSAGLVCELVLRKVKKNEHRIAICTVILILLLLIWAELAVGVFGTSFSGQ
jgi:ABC-type cobalt transport system substrate-binding protein